MALQVEGSEGPKLVASGTYITLGGSRVQVRFDNRALVELERRWGSINAWAQELQKGEKGKLFTCISDGIAATVRGLPVDPIDLIDPSRIIEYADAIGNAFQEAIPTVTEDAQQAGQKPDAPLDGSSSSTPESSDSGWRPPTSGA